MWKICLFLNFLSSAAGGEQDRHGLPLSVAVECNVVLISANFYGRLKRKQLSIKQRLILKRFVCMKPP